MCLCLSMCLCPSLSSICAILPSVYLYVCISVCLYICMSVYLYVCISVCLYICMSVYAMHILCLYIYIHTHKHVCIHIIYTLHTHTLSLSLSHFTASALNKLSSSSSSLSLSLSLTHTTLCPHTSLPTNLQSPPPPFPAPRNTQVRVCIIHSSAVRTSDILGEVRRQARERVDPRSPGCGCQIGQGALVAACQMRQVRQDGLVPAVQCVIMRWLLQRNKTLFMFGR